MKTVEEEEMEEEEEEGDNLVLPGWGMPWLLVNQLLPMVQCSCAETSHLQYSCWNYGMWGTSLLHTVGK